MAVAVAPPPLLARRREWATLAPLQPASQPRLATAVHIAPAEVLAAPGSLVHRVEPAVTRADRPVGMWEDAAHVVGALAPLPTERAVSPSPPADVVLPALTYRQAPVVAPEPVRVIEPEPAPTPAPVPAPPAADVAAPSVATTPVAPEPPALVLPAASGPSSSDEADDIEEQAAAVIRRPNLGQTRRLGLGPPIVRTPDPEPESVPDDVASALRSAYGVEVGDVVVRRDAAAAAEARDLGAAAFAREGQEVVVPIEVGPLDRPVGKGIVAHELTHIAQQRRHGPGLPAEDSPQGQALEAAARAAEQYFRGDAGAPRPAAPHAVAPDQVLTTGVAALDDAGEVVFVAPARPVAPVQRLTLAATTPPYVWQRIAAPVADDQAELDAATAVVLDEAAALGEPDDGHDRDRRRPARAGQPLRARPVPPAPARAVRRRRAGAARPDALRRAGAGARHRHHRAVGRRGGDRDPARRARARAAPPHRGGGDRERGRRRGVGRAAPARRGPPTPAPCRSPSTTSPRSSACGARSPASKPRIRSCSTRLWEVWSGPSSVPATCSARRSPACARCRSSARR